MASTTEEVGEEQPAEPKYKQTVKLNPADCGLDFDVEENGLTGQGLYDNAFAYCWSGARATAGIRAGKYVFGCKVVSAQPVVMKDTPLDQQHVCRIGISKGDNATGNLGHTLNSFGYGGAGNFSNAGTFSDYGEKFGVGDTIVCTVNLDSKPLASIGFYKNGKWLGVAKEFDAGKTGHGVVDCNLKERKWESAFFPHVLLKNVVVEMQFSVDDGLMIEGHKAWDCAFEDGNAIAGPVFDNPKDCEVLMMVGLPASGKTTWAEKWVNNHPRKRYILLGTNPALDQKKVGERFDQLMDLATGAMNTLLARAAKTARNYIIDQTNVSKSSRKSILRPFLQYQKIAVVVFPKPDILKSHTEKRLQKMGKEVPAEAVNEMLANYDLPTSKDMHGSDEHFDQVWFPELNRGESQRYLGEMKHALESSSNSLHSKKVGLIYHANMLKHKAIRKGQIEDPKRLEYVWEELTKSGMTKRCSLYVSEDVEERRLLSVHRNNYINSIKTWATDDSKKKAQLLKFFDDVYMCRYSAGAALLAAGSVVQACHLVQRGVVASAMALVRPPGHHAEAARARGFCIFSNVAIGAKSLLDDNLVQRILIVDWDIHHGNGTQDAFYHDDRVLFFSVHRYDPKVFYPYDESGNYTSIGEGRGRGFNINVPLNKIPSGNADYYAIWDQILLPVAENFNPDIILISAGFDAAQGEKFEFDVTPQAFGLMLAMLMHLAHGKIVLALEGGYEPEILHNCIDVCLKTLLGDLTCTQLPSAQVAEETQIVIDQVRRLHKENWPCFAEVSQERPHRAQTQLAEKDARKAPKAVGTKLPKEKSSVAASQNMKKSAAKAPITTHAEETSTIVTEKVPTPTKEKEMTTERQVQKKLAEKDAKKAPKAVGTKLPKEKSCVAASQNMKKPASKAPITTHAEETSTIATEIVPTPTKEKEMRKASSEETCRERRKKSSQSCGDEAAQGEEQWCCPNPN